MCNKNKFQTQGVVFHFNDTAFVSRNTICPPQRINAHLCNNLCKLVRRGGSVDKSWFFLMLRSYKIFTAFCPWK